MDGDTKAAGSINVGQRLRLLREERGISMRGLARLSNLSANALSMIERGMTSPSVSTLSKLALALEIPIMAFFRSEPRREDIVFRKTNERTRVAFPGGLWEGLGGEVFSGRIEAIMLTLEADGTSGPHGMMHTGQEFVFCVQGQLEYEVEGQIFLLEAGDSLIFTAHYVHRWRNPGQEVTLAVIVISSFEEGERPSEYHMASQSNEKSGSEIEI
jgi:transcriptional regulator with XRE-family HTH domain